MTAPIWLASPPEIHSTLLSSGPGLGPLLAAAATWRALSADYATAADELTALLGAVQAGAWQGPSAQAYVVANAPYLAWLLQAGADSAAVATAQDTAAGAYTAALAAMPTLAELAANHATHAVLLGTNFFGINTIPIALNEADYLRMWVQAATVMGTYQAVAGSAVAAAAAARTPPAPTVLKTPTMAAEATQPQTPEWFEQLRQYLYSLLSQPDWPQQNVPLYDAIMKFFDSIGFTDVADPFADFYAGLSELMPWLPLHGEWLWMTGNPFSYLNPGFFAYILSVPLDPGSFIAFTAKVIIDDILLILYTAVANPQAFFLVAPLAVVEMIGSTLGNIVQVLNYLLTQTVLLPALLPMLAGTTVLAPAGVLGGLGLGALAKLAPVVAAVPAAPVPPVFGAAVPSPPTPAPAPAPAPTPAPSPASAPAPAPPPGAPPPTPAGPPSVGMPGYLYLVGDLGAGARRAAGTSARKRPAPEPDSAEEPAPEAVAPTPAQRRRKRVKTPMLGRGREYMDLEPEPATASAGSDRGARRLGLTGATHREAAGRPAGLTALAGDMFDGAATTPMLPGTWVSDSD